jgi:uncharacterized protein YfkK (UPF0435 family)
MGLKRFLKKAAKKGLPLAADFIPGGGLARTVIKQGLRLATKREDRLQQITNALIKAKTKDKVEDLAELIEDLADLSQLIETTTRDKKISPEEAELLAETLKELRRDIRKTVKKIF